MLKTADPVPTAFQAPILRQGVRARRGSGPAVSIGMKWSPV